MKIECPHCSQSIDLGDDPPSSFPCPTCSGLVQLQMKATAVNPPPSGSQAQGVKLPVLLGAIACAVGLSLLLGWFLWGKPDPEASLPMSERILGEWEQVEKVTTLIRQFSRDGTWEEKWFVNATMDPTKDEPGFSLYGEYRVEGDTLSMRQKMSNSGTNPFSDWVDFSFSIQGANLEFGSLGKGAEAQKYRRLKD